MSQISTVQKLLIFVILTELVNEPIHNQMFFVAFNFNILYNKMHQQSPGIELSFPTTKLCIVKREVIKQLISLR